MAFTYRDGIAVLQLIAFFPALVLSLILCFRQGLRAVAACWRFLIILAALRVAGAICQFILINNPGNSSVITAKLTCDLLGIAPLTLAAVGLLQRCDATVERIPKNAFRFVTLVSLVGLALGIYGATQAVDAVTNGDSKIPDMLIAALAMFVTCLGLMICLLLWLTPSMSRMPHAERIIMRSVYACTPFLVVRMIYACIGDFGQNPDFSIYGGNDTIYLCMSVLMEIILMAICLVVGFKCPPSEESVSRSSSSSSHKRKRSHRKHRHRHRHSSRHEKRRPFDKHRRSDEQRDFDQHYP